MTAAIGDSITMIFAITIERVQTRCTVAEMYLPQKVLSSLMLKSKPLLVTGATGFIGSQLTLRLATVEEANVTATGRDPSKVADAFAQTDVALTRAYLLDQQAMRQVLRGQELIYHLAGWMGLDGWMGMGWDGMERM